MRDDGAVVYLTNEANQSLVTASSGRVIEEAAYRIIDNAYPYEFACIAALDRIDDILEVPDAGA